MIGITLFGDEIPTCTCTPQISIWRPHHWVRLISSAYRGPGVSFCVDHCANGWVPAQNSSMPRASTIRRAGPSVARRSSIASGADRQMPLTTSTVLRSNSLCTRGFSPISAMTAVASLLRSRVCWSTSANSHSTPMVGRGERAKSIRASALSKALLAGTDDTARHPLAGVTGAHRHLVGPRRSVALVVALRRDVGEIVRAGMNDDRGLLAAEQIIHGEGVRGGHQRRRTVPAHLKRGEVTTGGLGGRPGHLEVPARGQEIPRGTTGRAHRVGLALADLVNVHPVEARRKHTVGGRLDGHGGIAVVELERRRRDLGAVGRPQVGGDVRGRSGGRLLLVARCRRRRYAGPDRRHGARSRRCVLWRRASAQQNDGTRQNQGQLSHSRSLTRAHPVMRTMTPGGWLLSAGILGSTAAPRFLPTASAVACSSSASV